MATSITAARLRALRLGAQLLTGPGAGSVAGAAAHMGGLQAQAAPPARLAARARISGLTAADVDQACAARDVTRTWLMRGTLHMVATHDVRWMTGLLGPVFARKDQRRREQLGLDEALCERALTALADILSGSPPLTRAELIGRLAAKGIRIDPRTQQAPHLLGYAAFRGLICRGPDAAGEEPTYVLLDEWAPDAPALSKDEALSELARRYLGGYGPASREDFAAWSGLPAAECTRALDLIAGDVTPVSYVGARLLALAGSSPETPGDPGRHGDLGDPGDASDPGDAGDLAPRLLGHFDAYLLGYWDRGLVLDARYARRIQTGGGFVRPVVLIGGRVAGTWRLTLRAGKGRPGAPARLTMEPFTALPAASADGLAAEAADIGRFLGVDVTLETISEAVEP